MPLLRAGWACLFVTGLLSAQYPGQYPPGGYPGRYPGRYPGGYPGSGGTLGGGLPTPRLPGRGKDKKESTTNRKPSDKEPLQTFAGKIQTVDKDALTVQLEDTRLMTFRFWNGTKYRDSEKEIERNQLRPGSEVNIEARSDKEGYFYAVTVTVRKMASTEAASGERASGETASGETAAKTPGKEAPKEPDEQESYPATVVKGPDRAEPDVPKLRRGKPEPRAKRQEDAEPVLVASSKPTPAKPGAAATPGTAAGAVRADKPEAPLDDPLLDKARQVATDFTESLPNYICNQFTTRFQGEGRPIRWQPLDVVSAAVAYQDGVESYHDIKINNKPTRKPMEEMNGSWSRGEFGTTLKDVFAPSTAAVFHKRGNSDASGRTAVMYDFEVEQPHSHWQTIIGGQSVRPAYKGSVWIDKQTARVLRVEMQALKVPASFPLDTIEWVVDYAFVRIGTAEFLLPTHAENLACWRGTGQCARNALDFRNYRKFSSESQIMTTDSTVNFDKDEPPAPARKK